MCLISTLCCSRKAEYDSKHFLKWPWRVFTISNQIIAQNDADIVKAQHGNIDTHYLVRRIIIFKINHKDYQRLLFCITFALMEPNDTVFQFKKERTKFKTFFNRFCEAVIKCFCFRRSTFMMTARALNRTRLLIFCFYLNNNITNCTLLSISHLAWLVSFHSIIILFTQQLIWLWFIFLIKYWEILVICTSEADSDLCYWNGGRIFTSTKQEMRFEFALCFV